MRVKIRVLMTGKLQCCCESSLRAVVELEGMCGSHSLSSAGAVALCVKGADLQLSTRTPSSES